MVTAKLTEKSSHTYGSIGTSVKTQENRDVNLSWKESWSIDGDARGTEITCIKGALWVTQENDRRDYILYPGSKFVVSCPGRVTAQGLFKGTMRVSR